LTGVAGLVIALLTVHLTGNWEPHFGAEHGNAVFGGRAGLVIDLQPKRCG
jgi:hypothetical protein